ncbi:hypothetical protein DRI50_12260 [candidate division KSB1 bacterium]|nr:MAG: hypothetical protein DRI50_12260 [candidate division KSB1 bacterium]
MLNVDRTEINLTGNPFLDKILIINNGGGQLQWDIQEKPDWVDVSDLVGRITDDTATVRFSTKFDNLDYGVYSGMVKINSNGGVIEIKLTLDYKPPKLKVEKIVINMDRHYNRAELGIINEGGGELTWSIAEKPDWLSFQVEDGVVYSFPQYVPFQINFNALDYGYYESAIKLDSNGGSVEIAVYFTYEREIEVYPGVGAAYVTLGESYSAVQKQWGTPDKNWYDRPEHTLFIHHFTYDEIGLHFAVKTNSLILYGSGKVGYIEVFPPYDGMTEELLGIGSTVNELKAAKGDPLAINGGQWTYEGIIFLIKNNMINGMIVKDPDF